MSIWISRAFRLFLLLALPGCLTGPEVTRRAPERIAVANHSVVVAGPPGYCIDTSATTDSVTGAFVLLGSCASIANSPRAKTPAEPALLTASVSPTSLAAATASVDQLASFFRSPNGRAALARSGQTSAVRILDMQSRGDAIYIHATDSSVDPADGLTTDYWRGIFDLGGRLVTVSVIGFSKRPITDAASIATLDAFADRIRFENRGSVSDSQTERSPE